MFDVVLQEAFDAGRILFIGGLVAVFVHNGARASGERHGRAIALLRWVGGACALAFVFAMAMGQPTCESNDGDGCDSYADDGFTPTLDQQLGRFVWVAVVLGVPAVFGIFDSRRFVANPWAKPEISKPE